MQKQCKTPEVSKKRNLSYCAKNIEKKAEHMPITEKYLAYTDTDVKTITDLSTTGIKGVTHSYFFL